MEAEAELARLREQMGKFSTDGAGVGTPQVVRTNLKEKMDDAAKTGFRTGRRGRVKMTAGRLLRDDSARKANDRYVFVEDERKRLKALKKGGLEPLCKEAGIKCKTVEIMVDELAELNAEKRFGGSCSSDDRTDPDQDHDFWAIRGCKGVLVKQRAKGAKLRFGGAQLGWKSISLGVLVDFVRFDLDCTFFKACGQMLQQKVGIPMGKSSSPALACFMCTYNEFRFLLSLGCNSKLGCGIRMVDDVSVFVRYKDGDPESLAVAQSILSRFRYCYDSNLVLELTSDSDCWDFVGCVVKVLDWPWGIQCIALHKNQRFFGEDKLRFQNLQDFNSFSCKEQKMAVIGSCLHRAKAYTTMAGMEVAFLLTLKIELRKRSFPDAYFDNTLQNFSRKFRGIWDEWVTCLTGWGDLFLK
ncbi:hypothetical protein CBR_g52445 [Chara braunii]|uniref:Reverse transcriptase domain-containing protein n=1 Tax=Chara braunii TaxID=69332 RepID=A0A388MAA9_CHABU|nr:hypothetical protein CBR_g52445 [Chara braunii]|eukprot:GBG91490.1 hypothetical protein CBR_g52445 [Chara braunii]